MWEAGMRAFLAARWKLTPFSVKQRAVNEGAAKYDEAIALADSLGLLVPLDVLKPPVEGPNAADVYERLTEEIKGLANQVDGTPRALQLAAAAKPLIAAQATRVLAVWADILTSGQEASEIAACRLPNRYVSEQTDFEALKTIKTLAQGFHVRVRLAGLQRNDDQMRRDLHSIARLSAHATSEPLRLASLISCAIERIWFSAASVCLRVKEMHPAVAESLSLLPPVPTIRSTLAGEVCYACARAKWPPSHFDELKRFRMPRAMIEELMRLDRIGLFFAAQSVFAQCDLERQLPRDETSNGPECAAIYFENVHFDAKGIMGSIDLWYLISVPDGSKVNLYQTYKNAGTFPAMAHSMQNVIRMALDCYRLHDATGRFPNSLDGAIDPVTLQPYEYRNHGNRFIIFGKGVEFDSDPNAPLP